MSKKLGFVGRATGPMGLAVLCVLAGACGSGNAVSGVADSAQETSRSGADADGADVGAEIGESSVALELVGGTAPDATVSRSTVAVLANGSLCSGTIIGPRHVLTAAHCSKRDNPARQVVFGPRANAKERRTVESVTLHDRGADLALVTFKGALPAGYRRVDVVSGALGLTAGTEVLSAGYGKSSVTVPNASGTLLQGPLRIVRAISQRSLLQLTTVAGANLCFGDSGGPTFLRRDPALGLLLLGVNHAIDSQACDRNSFVVDMRAHRDWLARIADPELSSALETPAAGDANPTSPAPAPTAMPPAPVPTAVPPAPAPTAQPGPVSSDLAAFAREVLALSNRARAQSGAAPLAFADALIAAAQAHAVDMAVNRYFSHSSRDGTSPFTRMARAGYPGRMMGENIAMGQRTPASVMDSWMNSPGHRANILNANFRELGVGIARAADGRLYWVQNFGRR